MKKIALLSAMSMSLLFGCGEELEVIQVEVKEVECDKENRYKDIGCSLTTIDDRIYIYGRDLYYVNEGCKLELEVKDFNKIVSMKYLEGGQENE